MNFKKRSIAKIYVNVNMSQQQAWRKMAEAKKKKKKQTAKNLPNQHMLCQGVYECINTL